MDFIEEKGEDGTVHRYLTRQPRSVPPKVQLSLSLLDMPLLPTHYLPPQDPRLVIIDPGLYGGALTTSARPTKINLNGEPITPDKAKEIEALMRTKRGDETPVAFYPVPPPVRNSMVEVQAMMRACLGVTQRPGPVLTSFLDPVDVDRTQELRATLLIALRAAQGGLVRELAFSSVERMHDRLQTWSWGYAHNILDGYHLLWGEDASALEHLHLDLIYWCMRERRLWNDGYPARYARDKERCFHGATGADRRFAQWRLALHQTLALLLDVAEMHKP